MIQLDVLAGALTGILSGWGIGGGSLLVLYMDVIRGITQQTAQGINLAYFLPVSAGSLVSHIKNGLIDKEAAIVTGVSGIISALAAALLANVLNVDIMHRLFGVFLIIVGIKEVFHKKRED